MPNVVKDKNLRAMEITPSSGTEAKESPMMNTLAKSTPAESATNMTKQYTTPAMKKGPLGGKNSNS